MSHVNIMKKQKAKLRDSGKITGLYSPKTTVVKTEGRNTGPDEGRPDAAVRAAGPGPRGRPEGQRPKLAPARGWGRLHPGADARVWPWQWPRRRLCPGNARRSTEEPEQFTRRGIRWEGHHLGDGGRGQGHGDPTSHCQDMH